VEAILLWLVILGAAMGGGSALQVRRRPLRFPVGTIAIALVTLAFSVWGNLNPDILHALRRYRDRLLDGEWWRLVTPLVVQDGGWTGTIFNIAAFLVLGAMVESLFGWRWLVITYLAAGLVSEVVAYTLIRDQGFAGNSVAVMGVAGLLAVTCLLTPSPRARIPGMVGMLAGLALIVTANLHGAGFAVGGAAGILLTIRNHP
jgi:rhomboid protease GluP